MAQLADILVSLTLDTSKFKKQLDGVGQELNNFRNRVRQTTSDLNGDFSNNLSQMATNLQGLDRATTNASNRITSDLDAVGESVNRMGSSTIRASRTLGTGFQDMRKMVRSARTEFNSFGMVGRNVAMSVSEDFKYLPKHLQRYVQRLQEAGQSTVAFSQLNEKYGQRNLETLRRTNDYMQSKTMKSTRLIQALRDQNMMPLSQQFLKLGQRLEDSARKGSALNLALTQLGKNASPKEVAERVKLIKEGVGRATITMMGMGIATGLAIWGLVKMSNVVDGRLKPAFETLKSTWLDALTPFVKAFTTFVVWIMKGATAIGGLMKKFAEAHPQLSQMFWGFLLLTMALTALLAPLAVGIGLTGGLSAGFALLWAVIGPFILGFLTVAGVAVLVAGAIVLVTAVINNLWKNSLRFRNAWIAVWEGVKSAFVAGFAKPVSDSWNTLKTAFAGLISAFTGGGGTMGSLWAYLGDKIAIVVNHMAGIVLPMLQTAFTVLGFIVSGVIKGVVIVLTWLTAMWKTHGDTIQATVAMIWGKVKEAFGHIQAFVASVMPSIMNLISTGFQLIKQIIDFTMKYIAPVVVGAFKVIWEIIKFVMPFILNIIKSVWANIKNVITSTIGIIQGVIKLFSSILKGDWKGAWDAVKSILKNSVILIWNLIQLYFIGKMLKVFASFGSSALGLVKSTWTGILNVIKAVGNGIKSFVVAIFNAVKTFITSTFTQIKTSVGSSVTSMKTKVVSAFNGIKSKATSIFNAVKSAITKPIETAKNTVLKIIDVIKGAFAGMAITIPKPKVPSFDVGSKTMFGGKGGLPAVKVPTFKVNWNAKGGVFNGASILGGGQGVGEAGAEAVLPIQHKRYMKPFASAVASHLNSGNTTPQSVQGGGDKYEIHFNEAVVIREDADITRIVDALDKRKKIEQRARGVFSY